MPHSATVSPLGYRGVSPRGRKQDGPYRFGPCRVGPQRFGPRCNAPVAQDSASLHRTSIGDEPRSPRIVPTEDLP
ncbi:MAG: hypothetical protein RIS70_2182 [Planctomycetota bacterium]|jgi:hypothetical protein